MKKLILLAGVAALAACGGGSDDVVVDNTMTVDTTPTTTADAGTDNYVGTHTVYDADGNMLDTTVVNADGTYNETNADGSTAQGTWRTTSGNLCFDQDGNTEAETCWTKGEMVDGRQAWTNPDGETVYVVMTA